MSKFRKKRTSYSSSTSSSRPEVYCTDGGRPAAVDRMGMDGPDHLPGRQRRTRRESPKDEHHRLCGKLRSLRNQPSRCVFAAQSVCADAQMLFAATRAFRGTKNSRRWCSIAPVLQGFLFLPTFGLVAFTIPPCIVFLCTVRCAGVSIAIAGAFLVARNNVLLIAFVRVVGGLRFLVIGWRVRICMLEDCACMLFLQRFFRFSVLFTAALQCAEFFELLEEELCFC